MCSKPFTLWLSLFCRAVSVALLLSLCCRSLFLSLRLLRRFFFFFTGFSCEREQSNLSQKNTWKKGKKKEILKRSSFLLPSDEQVWAVAVNVQAVHQIPNCLNHLCWESNQENLAIRLDKGISFYITWKRYLKWLFHLVSRSDTVKLWSVPTSLPSLSLASFPSNTASSDRQ